MHYAIKQLFSKNKLLEQMFFLFLDQSYSHGIETYHA